MYSLRSGLPTNFRCSLPNVPLNADIKSLQKMTHHPSILTQTDEACNVMNTCGRVFVPNLGIFCSYHFGDHHLGFDACYRNCINSDHRDRRQKLWFTDNSSYYRCAQIEIRRDRKAKWNSTKCHWRLTDWNLEDKSSVFYCYCQI